MGQPLLAKSVLPRCALLSVGAHIPLYTCSPCWASMPPRLLLGFRLATASPTSSQSVAWDLSSIRSPMQSPTRKACCQLEVPFLHRVFLIKLSPTLFLLRRRHVGSMKCFS